MTTEEFWREFLEFKKNKSLTYFDCFHFELTEELANELLDLVLSGKKQATCSSLSAYEVGNNRIPQIGDYSIVTEWNATPRCVIETTAVTILPFRDITFEICKREGEDDNLDSWQSGHKRFFIEEGKELGYEFKEEMLVIFEDFKVVFTNEILFKSFGDILQGKEYKDRVGAYAIIFNNQNEIAVVKTPTGYFLLGGGIEDNETDQECIIRECLEEAGIAVVVKQFICKGAKYHWSDTLEYYMHGIGYFYYADLIDKVAEPTEIDHQLVWLSIDDCCDKLFLEHQAWAVRQAVLLQE